MIRGGFVENFSLVGPVGAVNVYECQVYVPYIYVYMYVAHG